MQFHLKVDKFKNEIRRRQRAEAVEHMRLTFQQQQQAQDRSEAHQALAQLVANFHPTVHPLLLQQFNSLTILPSVEYTINNFLHPAHVLNLMFVYKCVSVYELETGGFFDRLVQGMAGARVEGEARQKLSQYRHLLGLELRQVEELYIAYFVLYLNSLKEKQAVTLSQVSAVVEYFMAYWNNNIEEGTLNLRLCAEMAERLLKFSFQVDSLSDRLRAIILHLVEHDTSYETYYAVKVACKHNLDLCFSIAMQAKVADFLYRGVGVPATLKPALDIMETLAESEALAEAAHIDYGKVVDEMLVVYFKTQKQKTQRYVLCGLYNILIAQESKIRDKMVGLDYQQMYLKCFSANFFDFCDFCLQVLLHYMEKELFDRMLCGQQLKLVEVGLQYFPENKSHLWQFFDLLEAVLSEGLAKKINIHRHIGHVEGIKNMLQTVSYEESQCLSEKQDIIQRYERLLQQLSANRQSQV